MCGVASDIAGDLLDAGAKKKNFAAQQAIFNNDVGQQHTNFDARTAAVRASDKSLLDINSSQFEAGQGLEKSTYDYLLSNRAGAANDQAGYDNALNTDQTGAARSLVTAGRQARLDQQSVLDAERARQAGFQGEADAGAGTFAATLGQPGFDAARTASTTARDAFMAKNASGPAEQFSNDAAVQGEFARQLASRVGVAQQRASGANAVAGYDDALDAGNRNMTGFRQALDTLGTKASLSEAPLRSEFDVADTQRAAATDEANYVNSRAQRQYAGDTSRSSTYHSGLADAMSSFAAGKGGANDAYFGNSTGAEQQHISSVVDASKAYQAALTNLANYKMGNTTTYSPFGTALHSAYKVGQAVNSAIAGAG